MHKTTGAIDASAIGLLDAFAITADAGSPPDGACRADHASNRCGNRLNSRLPQNSFSLLRSSTVQRSFWSLLFHTPSRRKNCALPPSEHSLVCSTLCLGHTTSARYRGHLDFPGVVARNVQRHRSPWLAPRAGEKRSLPRRNRNRGVRVTPRPVPDWPNSAGACISRCALDQRRTGEAVHEGDNRFPAGSTAVAALNSGRWYNLSHAAFLVVHPTDAADRRFS